MKKMLMTILLASLIVLACAGTSAAQSAADAVEIMIPETLELGENLNVRLKTPDSMTLSVLTLYYMDGVEPEALSSYSQRPEYKDSDGINYATFSYSNNLIEPGNYRLEAVTTLGDGANAPQIVTAKSFSVSGVRPAAPRVTADSSVVTKDGFTSFEIRPGTGQTGITETEIRYFVTEENNRWESYGYGILTGEGYVRFQLKQYSAGRRGYSFSVRINGLWSEYSEKVWIECRSLGQLNPPDGAVIPEQIEAGEPLYIDFSQAGNAAEYFVTVEQNGSLAGSGSVSGNGKLEVLPFGLDGGSYTVYIRASSPGYDDSEFSSGKALTVSGSRPGVPAVTYPEGVHYINERVWVTLRAEGLEAVTEGYSGSQTYLCDGRTGYFPIRASWPGYGERHNLRARINGRWTDSFSVSYEGTEDDFDDMDLEVLSFPDSILLGEALPFRTEMPDGADAFTYSISYVIEDNSEYKSTEQIVYDYLYTPDANGNGSIPAQFFTRPGEYDVGFDVRGDDVYKYCTKRLIVVKNPNVPSAPTVAVTTAAPKLYEDVKIRISAKGGTKACLIIKDASDNNSVILNPFEIGMTNGSCEYTFNLMNFPFYYHGQDYLVIACVFNGTAWSEYSSPVTVRFADTDGAVAVNEETLHLDPRNPETGDQMKLSWDAVQGAEYYQILLDWDVILYTGNNTVRTCTLNTRDLELGEHYLTLKAYAAGKTYGEDTKRFFLLDPAAKPALTADKTEAELNELITLTIRTVKGEFIYLYMDEETCQLIPRSSSGTQTAVLRIARGGIHTIRVMTGDTPYNEPTSAASDPVVIRVGQKADINLPAELTRIDAEAFRNVRNVTVRVPGNLTDIASDAIDRSVTILAPSGSPAAVWFKEHGYTVIEE